METAGAFRAVMLQPASLLAVYSSLASAMIIRKYSEDDRNGLIQLWESSFPDDPPHNEPSRIIQEKLLIDDLIFIAEENMQIIGACMAGYDGHRGWLYAVAVASDQRRRGIGKSLIEEAGKSLKNLGCSKINLQIRSSNQEVKAFYESLGFGVEERISMGLLLE